MSQKKVGIDGRTLPTSGGVSTYVSNLLRHISVLDPLSSRFPKNNFLWNLMRVPVSALHRKWNLFHAPAYTAPLLCPCPVVLSVHDISYLVRKEWYPYQVDSLRRAFYRISMKRADLIIVPSLFSRSEVIRVISSFEPKIRCVPLAVSRNFYPDEKGAERVRQKFGLPGRFILHVGDIHPRRNIEILDKSALESDFPVVLVGRDLVPVKTRARTIKLQSISVDDLRGCYSAASVFVYPSVYEGFGLPLLEAMACGLPVVAADRASIPEVCGESAVLVEPSVEALCQGIEKALINKTELIERGLSRVSNFGWKKTARKTIHVYEELIGSIGAS